MAEFVSPRRPTGARRRTAARSKSPELASGSGTDPLLRLQKQVGNRALLGLLRAQAALEVGAVDDPLEHQADAVATQVVQLLADPSVPAAEAEVAMAPDATPSAVRRAGGLPVGPSGGALDGETEVSLAAARSSGAGLDSGVRGAMESAFGADFSQVRMHHDSGARALNHQLGARAFTVGSDIFFRDGVPDVNDRDGAHLLAHELTHTIQQGGVGARASRSVRTRGGDAANGLVQRRGAGLPAVNALKDEGPVWLPGGGDDIYDPIIDAVPDYTNDSKVPATDYGKQLHFLRVRIQEEITKWEAANGPVTQAVQSGVFGLSRVDKRRGVLKKVRDALVLEKAAVSQQGLTEATAAHNQDRATLTQYVTEGMSSADRRLSNSCQWILTAGKAKLYAVTATGDSYARLALAGRPPDKDEAWFPTGLRGSPGDLKSPAATYNKDNIADNTGINLDDDGKITGGWNTPGLITITRPSRKPKETVWSTLRHEVQHDADKNEGRDAMADARGAAEAIDAAATVGARNVAKAKLQAEKACSCTRPSTAPTPTRRGRLVDATAPWITRPRTRHMGEVVQRPPARHLQAHLRGICPHQDALGRQLRTCQRQAVQGRGGRVLGSRHGGGQQVQLAAGGRFLA